MGKHNRPAETKASVSVSESDHAPAKLKKSKKHKDKHGSRDKSPSATKDSTSSTKKRKRDKQQPADDPTRDDDNVSPSDNTHADPLGVEKEQAPSSPPPAKKHKKHGKDKKRAIVDPGPEPEAEREVTFAEMLLEDREATKKAEAKAAEKAARKAERKERKERKRQREAAELKKSRSAPETAASTPEKERRRKKKAAKRSSSEGGGDVDGGCLKVGGKGDGEGNKPKATVEDVAERWNVGGLEGGSQRQSKFMRLLGAKKAGIAPVVAEVTKGGAGTDKMADELERQFEYGRKMKHESGGQRKGLGA